MLPPTEISFDINGRTLAALEWGDSNAPLVIALHGWLDNAASFSLIAPLLNRYRILALDMAGHGLSDWRRCESGYPVWSYVEDLRRIHLQLGAKPVALLGHSLGAGVATLYAGCWPEAVSAVGLLENIGPVTDSSSSFAQSLRDRIEAHLTPVDQSRPRSLDAWVRSRMSGNFPVPQEAARLLMQRNTAPDSGGLYRYRCDPAIKRPSLIALSEAQVQDLLSSIEAPVKLISGKQGVQRPLTHQRLSCVSRISQVVLPGGHHLHMETDTALAVAAELNAFYAETIDNKRSFQSEPG